MDGWNDKERIVAREDMKGKKKDWSVIQKHEGKGREGTEKRAGEVKIKDMKKGERWNKSNKRGKMDE